MVRGLLVGAALVLASCGPNGLAPGGKQAESEPSFAVANIAELRGTNYLVADVVDGAEGYRNSFSSSSGPSVRNLLLIQRDGGSSRFFLPDNRGRVENSFFIPARAGWPLTAFGEYSRSSSGEAYSSRDIDDDKTAPVYFVIDGHATTEQQSIDVRVGTLADLKSTTVLKGLDKVLSRWMIDDHRLAVIAERGSKTEYFEIDMKAQALLESHVIPVEIGRQ